MADAESAEHKRLSEDAAREKNWKRWGPYLAERQWATVREDYSEGGEVWDYFTHQDAVSRAYRWGEDGLLGMTDRECRLCFGWALWNGRDRILKERLFGLTGPQGNHGEDVKEAYFYLDSTPTHSYLKALYKYPLKPFPYELLIEENRRRSRGEAEFELADSGALDQHMDVLAEYAKSSPNDILGRLTLTNRGDEPGEIHVLPTIWFRNTWSWGCTHEGCALRPRIRAEAPGRLRLDHETLGAFYFHYGEGTEGWPEVLFTENDTNFEKLYGEPNPGRYVKDAFHRRLIEGELGATNPEGVGTKAAPYYRVRLAPGESAVVRVRWFGEAEAPGEPLGGFDDVLRERQREAQDFYDRVLPSELTDEEKRVGRQAHAGLLWTKQFYHYVVADWLTGDPGQPPPPSGRRARNQQWPHLFTRDVISMPDKWEYPWFAAWDLAFHMLPMARLDSDFAKRQLILLLREWYMHPNGQLPAYEFAFDDVNPPVHAWAAWRVYKIAARAGRRDRDFLESVFQKLLLNFTWWVNRKDSEGNNLFSGGFLGLDNIGVFDRSKPLPTGGHLQQADGTAWMAFYCATMLNMALELAQDQRGLRVGYEDMASKFFEHFLQISDAMNRHGGTGLWNEQDGFYYDHLRTDHELTILRTRSLVGLMPLIAVAVLPEPQIQRLPGFQKRLNWHLEHRQDLAGQITYCEKAGGKRLLAIPSRARLERVLRYMLDEAEFLSPFGIRSLSKFHEQSPFELHAGGALHKVSYEPGESTTGLFGGNSNWRGPVWFPINYLIIEALEQYHHFYGNGLTVEFPTGSGRRVTLEQVADALSARMASLFLPDDQGRRPCHGADGRFADDPAWRDLVLFHEYFHGETGQGLGASHQTGWTALVTRNLESIAARRRTASGG